MGFWYILLYRLSQFSLVSQLYNRHGTIFPDSVVSLVGVSLGGDILFFPGTTNISLGTTLPVMARAAYSSSSLAPEHSGGFTLGSGLQRKRSKGEGSRSRSRSRSTSRAPSLSFNPRSRSSTTASFINFLSDGGDNGSRYQSTRFNNASNKDRVVSLYRLLMLELNLPFEASGHKKLVPEDPMDDSYEQIVNMVRIPMVLEKFMALGLIICFNSFLTLFTLVPIRIIVITLIGIKSIITQRQFQFRQVFSKFSLARKDTLTVSLILCALFVLSFPSLDISKMYHDVRGQAQIKLYVMFGVLEVADKLCSSIGQNILSILYQLVTTDFTPHQLSKFLIFFIASITYLSIHGFILIYQTVSLNVAANSYSNALLTLLFSNQFSELRGSVFKKFEREGLFQVAMADLTERYQLSLMLGMIALRNLLQLSSINLGLIPNSWQSWNKWFGALFGPSIGVLGSEMLVDWLKHCYITKFNRIRPRVYHNFVYVLALDYLEVFKSTSSQSSQLYELSDYIILTKRIGLPLLATTVCFVRMSFNDFWNIFSFKGSTKLYSILGSGLLLSVSGILILLLRLILGLVLLKLTSHIKQQHEVIHKSETGDNKWELERSNSFKSRGKGLFLSKFNSSEIELNVGNLSSKVGIMKSKDEVLESDKEDLTDENNSNPYDNDNDNDYNTESIQQSPKSPVELNFLSGIPNSEISTINPKTRNFLYDSDETIPLTLEEKRDAEYLKEERKFKDPHEGLNKVLRYEMSSKRIW